MSMGWLDYLKAHENDMTIITVANLAVYESEDVKKSPTQLIKELQEAWKKAKAYKLKGKTGTNFKIHTNELRYNETYLEITAEFPTDKGFHRKSYEQDIQRMKDNALRAGFEMIPIKKKK